MKQLISVSKNDFALATVLAMFFLSSNVYAATIELPNFGDVITFIGSLAASISAIGLAILSMYALIKSFKLVRAAF